MPPFVDLSFQKTFYSSSVAILNQAISCSKVHGVFPVHELFWFFVLSKCLQPSFVVSHLFSWHVRAMEQMCQFLRYHPPLRTWVLLMVLFLTFEGQDTEQNDGGEHQRNVHTRRKIAATHAEYLQVRQLCPDALPDSGFIRFCSPCHHIGNKCDVRIQWFRLGKLLEFTWTQ